MNDTNQEIDLNDNEDETSMSKDENKMNSRHISLVVSYALIIATACLVYILDSIAPAGIQVELLYFIPVFLTLRLAKNITIFISAAVCTILAEIGFYLSKGDINNLMATSNHVLALLAIWVTAILVFIEKKRRVVASHLCAIVAGSNDAIFSVDVFGYITSWNEGAQKLYEYSAKEIIGKHIDILNKDHGNSSSNFERLKKKLARAGIIKNLEVNRVTKSGINLVVSICLSPIKDLQNNIVGYSKIDRDITDEKIKTDSLEQAKREAENANATKVLFLANVSHEIRTPLAAILGYADRLYANESDPKECQAFLNIIRRNSIALLGLINDLLDVSKIDSDQLEVEIEIFSLEMLLSEVISLMKQRANEKGIELTVEVSGKIPTQLSTDSQRLRQILINLISNAIKFTKKGFVEVRLAFDDESSTLIFSVKDTGCGINSECQKNLFQPFMQGDASVRREHGGTGLGLYLSKKLALSLNSKLYLKYSDINNGSVFHLEIPLGDIDNIEFVKNFSIIPQDGEYDANLFPDSGLENQAILVVEDVKENRDLFEFYLKRAGANVTTAVDGEEGIEKIKEKENHFDLVFMDLQMPKIDGYKAIEILRQEMLYAGPVIALTAHAMQGEREKCINAGFSNHISKPVSAKKLVAVTKSTLKIPSDKKAFRSLSNYSESFVNGVLQNSMEIQDAFKGNLPPPVKKAIRHFLDHLPERIKNIEEACRSQDKARVKNLIHSFKGGAGVCGFMQLFTELDKLEEQIDLAFACNDFPEEKILLTLNRLRVSQGLRSSPQNSTDLHLS